MTIKELALVVERLRVEAEGCDPALIDKVISAGIPVSKASVEIARAVLPLIAAELAGVARDPKLIDQVSRGLAAGWRGNPNMSGDDRDFMHPSMRRRHNEKSADACEFIALAIEAHARKMGEA